MLWFYGHDIFFNSFSAGTVFRRQILTSKDGPRAEKVKRFPESFLPLFIVISAILSLILVRETYIDHVYMV